MSKPQSRDLKSLLDLELERNEPVRTAVAAYQQLAEGDRALFRLASGIAQDREDKGKESAPADQIQPMVKSLMKSLLEEHPSLLTESDIANLTDQDYSQNSLGLRIRGLPLLRRREAGRKGSDTDRKSRFYTKLYDGRFYVCCEWRRFYHLANAKSLLSFVGELASREPDHPSVPVLKRHMRALGEYINANSKDLSALEEQA